MGCRTTTEAGTVVKLCALEEEQVTQKKPRSLFGKKDKVMERESEKASLWWKILQCLSRASEHRLGCLDCHSSLPGSKHTTNLYNLVLPAATPTRTTVCPVDLWTSELFHFSLDQGPVLLLLLCSGLDELVSSISQQIFIGDYCVPNMLLDTEDKAFNKTEKIPWLQEGNRQ